ncbi:hypothetical protein NL676_028029 [Syzygium grande]|nr:hypothetical protein NL676_028029 [Syzygium grande]
MNRFWEVRLDGRSGMIIKTEAPLSKGEVRCIKRNELIEALARDLPDGTIRFGFHTLYIETDPVTSFRVLQLSNGSTSKAKVLLGCDGVNSVVLDCLEMNPTWVSYTSAARGLTSYPNSHEFDNVFAIAKTDYRFYYLEGSRTDKDAKLEVDPEFPRTEDRDKEKQQELLVEHAARYRAPWDLVYGRFRKGTVMVAGNALHAMSPFIGQGDSTSLEDMVMLARCLSRKLSEVEEGEDGKGSRGRKYEEALANYVEERRMRLIGCPCCLTYSISSTKGRAWR